MAAVTLYKAIGLIVLSSLLAAKSGDCLQCYICATEISWNDCDNSLKKSTCPEVVNEVCIKQLSTRNTVEGKKVTEYVRMCGLSSQCSIKGITCCTTDLCNSASPRYNSISGVVFAACVALLVRF